MTNGANQLTIQQLRFREKSDRCHSVFDSISQPLILSEDKTRAALIACEQMHTMSQEGSSARSVPPSSPPWSVPVRYFCRGCGRGPGLPRLFRQAEGPDDYGLGGRAKGGKKRPCKSGKSSVVAVDSPTLPPHLPRLPLRADPSRPAQAGWLGSFPSDADAASAARSVGRPGSVTTSASAQVGRGNPHSPSLPPFSPPLPRLRG